MMEHINNLFSANNDLINWIQNHGDPSNARNFGGVVPAYPIFMFIGIIVVIIASIVKMNLKKIPLRELELGIVIVVPLGILGATIFGKAFIPGMVWYHVFFFWEPGMSLFGALLLGTTAGFVWFYRRSKITLISVWVYADCILPNILLGQAIGRWGNLYNHEILGKVVDYDSLSWLTSSIRDQLFYFPSELSTLNLPHNWGQIVADNSTNLEQALDALVNAGLPSTQREQMLTVLSKPLEYREPLFLYESMANSFWWLILTFGISNLSRIFQKKNHYPWDVDPKAYPGWYNKKYPHLPESEIISFNSQKAIKYRGVQVNDQKELKLSFFNAWNKAYYWYEVPESELEPLIEQATKREERISKATEKIALLKAQEKKQTKQLKQSCQQKAQRYPKETEQYQLVWQKYQLEKQKNHLEYQNQIAEQKKSRGGFWYHFQINPDAKILTEVNNPHGFWILRCGVLSGGYIAGYLIIRIILETHRQTNELFIQNAPVADFIVLSLILIIGLVTIFFAQFVAPYKWREVGWLYEKSY